ncbi:MAG TPA: AraC family transcriptional regulator [Ideonella sp.]|uniref:AraC family transcriptional regulator n=1 Tax=Ideonella sp. TaxID=1929293 RepID=UPI002E36FC0F|nr:AraC family transcriptional regulator [Ideonella sp.]HEX5686416.1 AraC family transcriptional regulator [Ideonella sp.]
MPSAAASPPIHLPKLEHARVVGAYANTAIETAAARGAGLARLAEACGVATLAPSPDLTVRQYMQLLDAAAAELGDPTFGLQVGQRMRLATFAGYGLVLCTCRDFRAAAAQTCRFEGLAHDLGRSEIVERDGVAHYYWHSPWLDQPGARQLSESVVAGIRAFAHWLAGGALPASEVRFTHDRPAEVPAAVYEQALGVPVRFGAPVTELRFPSAVLDAQIPHADTSLFPELERLAGERLLARDRASQESPLLRQVREQVQARLMHDRATLGEVAAALALSARSLQRRLTEAGVPFTALVDETRRELAQRYLRDASLSLTEVAFLLGYRQQSSFNHAFRAWFDCTPAAWRAQALQADTSPAA